MEKAEKDTGEIKIENKIKAKWAREENKRNRRREKVMMRKN